MWILKNSWKYPRGSPWWAALHKQPQTEPETSSVTRPFAALLSGGGLTLKFLQIKLPYCNCNPYPELTEQPFRYLSTPGKRRKGTTETLLVPSYCSISICGAIASPRLDKNEICRKTANILLRMAALLHLWHMDFRLFPQQEYYLRIWRKTEETTVCALLILMLLSATKLRALWSHCSYNTKKFRIISLIEWTDVPKTHKSFIRRCVWIKFCKLLEIIHILQKVLKQS